MKTYLLKLVKDLELDLKNKIVLTEAASGAYKSTSILSALAGASVYAFCKESKYGTIDDIITEYKSLPFFNEISKQITFLDNLPTEIISRVDIITNSGHLRPISSGIIEKMKKGSIISLMFEKWELRDNDIDISAAKNSSIPIVAVNERHKEIDVFGYLGDMAMKLVFDSGTHFYKKKHILICNNPFGIYIANRISQICDLGVIGLNAQKNYYSDNITWLSDFYDLEIPEEYLEAETIIFSAYPFDKKWIGGENSIVDLNLFKHNKPKILRFAGDIDEADCIVNGFEIYPKSVKRGHMGILPSDIGNEPIYRLQAGSLKACQSYFENNFIYKNELIGEIL